MKTGKDGISDIISVFNMYEQKMYHIAYAILHDSYQAEDAVMDAFVRLLERQYSIEAPAANATKRLIIQVTRSAAIDLYRKNSRETERQTLVDDPSSLRSSGQEDAFTFEAGGVLELSPISLSIDMGKGLGLTNLEAYDPIHLNTMSIHYTDGSSYQVYDKDGYVDNTAYMCGGCGAAQTEIMLLFNRLIDPSKIDYVEVNGTVYSVTK